MPKLSRNLITEPYVAGLKPGKVKGITEQSHERKNAPAAHVYWDREIPGFGVQIRPLGRDQRGTGRATYYLKYLWRPNPAEKGKQVWLRLGKASDMTADEARALASEYRRMLRRGIDPAGAGSVDLTVQGRADLFLKDLKEDVANERRSKATLRAVDLAFRLALPVIGAMKIADVRRANIEDLRERLAVGWRPGDKKGTKPKRPTPILANRVIAHLSTLFTLAEKKEIRPQGTNPCKWAQDREVEHRKERFLSPLEYEWLGKVLNFANSWDEEAYGPRVCGSAIAALRLLAFTGARKEEILTMKWDQVDLEAATLTIREHKTKRTMGVKTIPLNAPARIVIRNQQEQVQQLGNPYVFPGRYTGRLVNLRSPWERIKAAVSVFSEGAVDLAGTRIHDLRHSFITTGVSAGLPLPVLGGLAGHAQAATTEKYAHKEQAPMREASETIGARLAALMPA